MQTYREFIDKHGVTMTSRRVQIEREGWDPAASHWKVTLRPARGGAAPFTINYSMGSAHTDDPDLADVLMCVASDIAGVRNATDFDDWADEYGTDMSTAAARRKARHDYDEIERQYKRLVTMLGLPAVEELLWQTEE